MHPLAATAIGFCITFTVLGLVRPKGIAQLVGTLALALALCLLLSRGLS